MAVIRINKTADYTIMSNTHFKEKRMSLKAKGLLSLMLSLPDGWDYSIAGLVTLSKDGKDSVMTALQELEEFCYLKRTRSIDEKGQFAGYDYDIFEKPYADKPNAETPNEENPYAENPNTENPPQLNTNQLITNQSSIKELKTKDVGEKQKRFSPPTVEEVKQYCLERKNKVDAERFVDYYTANGWLVGKNKMKDWKAAVRTWERNKFGNGNAGKVYGANGIEINTSQPDELDDIL